MCHGHPAHVCRPLHIFISLWLAAHGYPRTSSPCHVPLPPFQGFKIVGLPSTQGVALGYSILPFQGKEYAILWAKFNNQQLKFGC